MEDSHIAQFNIVPDVHIFGVFDGHGGKPTFSEQIFLVFCSFKFDRVSDLILFRQRSRAFRRKTFHSGIIGQ